MSRVLQKYSLKRALKKVMPLSGVVGIVSDVATPLASFSDYLTFIAAILASVLSVYWFFFFDRKRSWTMEEGFMPRALIYTAISLAVFGFFSVTQAMTDTQGKGLLANVVPGIEQLQRSVFRLEQNQIVMNKKLDRIEDQMDRKYGVKELKILADQEMWDEAMAHLEDTPPLERDGAWREVLEQIAVGWLYDMEIAEDTVDSHQKVTALFNKFKVLKKSSEAMEYRKKIGLGYLELCLREEPIKDCRRAARAFIRYDRNSVEDLSFAVGKLYTYYRLSRSAIPYFAETINKFNKDKYCGEERLAVAIGNSYHDSQDSEIAKQGRKLTKLCFDQLKEALREQIKKDKVYYISTKHICQIFSEEGEPIEHCSVLAKAKQQKQEKKKAQELRQKKKEAVLKKKKSQRKPASKKIKKSSSK